MTQETRCLKELVEVAGRCHQHCEVELKSRLVLRPCQRGVEVCQAEGSFRTRTRPTLGQLIFDEMIKLTRGVRGQG